MPPEDEPPPLTDPPPSTPSDQADDPPSDTPPLLAPRRKPGRPRTGRGRRRVAAARRVDKPTLTPRMSFFIHDDNSIDFDRTKPETIEQLRQAVTRPDAQKRLGLVNDAGTPTPPRTWTSMTATLVSSINALAVQAAVNTWKLTDDQAQLLLLHNDRQVDANGNTISQNVEQLTGELLDKYFPGGFGDYDKEISLLILLGGFTANAVQKIQATKTEGPREVVNFNRAADAGV